LRTVFKFKDKSLPLNQAHVMGILNVTPDSFSDGGHFRQLDQALKQAEQMIIDGAAIIDIGGESTRPGAQAVGLNEELDRVIPVIERLAKNTDVILSVDTSTPTVMKEAAAAGAHLINDVRALQRNGALDMVADLDLPVCLMHMQGTPEDMQNKPEYFDVVDEVSMFLADRLAACASSGIGQEKVLLDPGFGFGKTLEHNLRLINQLPKLLDNDCPLLVGMSRKTMVGAVLDKTVEHRLYGSLALAAASVLHGAFIVRVHDVAETYDVVCMMNAVRAERIIE
jgi:dihydropteroate synthase